VAQLCQHINDLESLAVRVVAISFGPVSNARAWLAETGAPFLMLLDSERVAYHAYGLEHSWLRGWGLKAARHYVRALLAGHRWRGIQGDTAQLGGDFIVDRNGIIRFAYRSHDPADRPPAGQLLAVLRQLDPKVDG